MCCESCLTLLQHPKSFSCGLCQPACFLAAHKCSTSNLLCVSRYCRFLPGHFFRCSVSCFSLPCSKARLSTLHECNSLRLRHGHPGSCCSLATHLAGCFLRPASCFTSLAAPIPAALLHPFLVEPPNPISCGPEGYVCVLSFCPPGLTATSCLSLPASSPSSLCRLGYAISCLGLNHLHPSGLPHLAASCVAFLCCALMPCALMLCVQRPMQCEIRALQLIHTALLLCPTPQT